MQHRNARLTPTGRLELVKLVVERQMTFEVDGLEVGGAVAPSGRAAATNAGLSAVGLVGLLLRKRS